MIDIALKYLKAGFSVLPTRGKIPTDTNGRNLIWRKFKTTPMTEEEAREYFSPDFIDGIGLVAGFGNLVIIDIDTKNDKTGLLWKYLQDDIRDTLGKDFVSPHTTPSGGYHFVYACHDIVDWEGMPQHLAKNKEGAPIIEFIKTQAPIPPSAGYEPTDGEFEIPTISIKQHEAFLSICRTHNQYFKTIKNPEETTETKSLNWKVTPFDAYDNDDSDPWRELLDDIFTPSEIPYHNTEEYERWKRIGSDNSVGASWHKQLRTFYVFTTATIFESERAYRPHAIYTILKHDGDWTAAARELHAKGYGEDLGWARAHEHNALKKIEKKGGLHAVTGDVKLATDIKDLRERAGQTQDELAKEVGVTRSYISQIERGDRPTPDAILKILQQHPKYRSGVKEYHKHDIKRLTELQHASEGYFWRIDKKGNPQIVDAKLSDVMRFWGFYRIKEKRGDLIENAILIYENNTIIKEASVHNIRAKMLEYVETREDWSGEEVEKEALRDAVYRFPENRLKTVEYMTEEKMRWEVDELKDTRDTCYLPFKNVVLKITRDGIEEVPNDDVPGKMFIDRINEREVTLNTLQTEADRCRCPFYRFLKRMSGISSDQDEIELKDLMKVNLKGYETFRAIKTHLGYLIHRYKDDAKPWLVWITEDTPNALEGGGTGKSLLMRAIGHVREVCDIPGKTWDARSQFKWQTVKLSTDIVNIDDATQWFRVERINSEITGTFELERKNQQPVKLQYSESPKVTVTSNYEPIDTQSDHLLRRVRKLYLVKHYGKSNTPDKEFGGVFWGSTWDEKPELWDLFFQLMAEFVSEYLRDGLYTQDGTINAGSRALTRKFKDLDVALDVESWAKGYIDTATDTQMLVAWKEIMNDFTEVNEHLSKEVHANTLRQALKDYCNAMGIDMRLIRGDDGNKWKFVDGNKDIKVKDVDEEELPF